MKKYILSLDEGTTSARAILFDKGGNAVSVAQREFTQIYPKPGFVEHDPMEIFSSQYSAITEAITQIGATPSQIAAVGVTNQRETVIIWDKLTGEPIYNAIVWQCRRTADLCEELKAEGLEPYVKSVTGLCIDAYFSGTKIKWILDNIEGAREKAQKGELLLGTVDTWLIWKLSGGKIHITDRTNASRTMLYNIHTLDWDDTLLKRLDIPRCMLPQVKSSSEIYGYVNILGEEIPVSGIAGDQQAALFGQKCFSAGDIKNTYGTGCFLLMNTGDKPFESENGLLTTIAASTKNDRVTYALEGSVFVGGAVVQWLRDEMGLIKTSAESEKAALSVKDSAGVYIVPAFAGLGAPYWDMYARGTICGLTRGANKNHIIRAALESIAYQTNDLITAMKADTGLQINSLKADGGAAANGFLMQFQSDISALSVVCPNSTEATAAGAAYLAGLGIGFWKSTDEIMSLNCENTVFTPKTTENERTKLLNGWKCAVKSTVAFSNNS
ncbi:MAG: glycerol kinase GlpK [Acutalibacteraceae bacterium]|nr:glycerol kinase GlpK [Acutalibacteraceae bacterium]